MLEADGVAAVEVVVYLIVMINYTVGADGLVVGLFDRP